jgi:hypothetical protein
MNETMLYRTLCYDSPTILWTRVIIMKKKLLLMSTILLGGMRLVAGEAGDTVESASALQEWNFNMLFEERIFSDKTSQTVLKLQTDSSLTEKISIFGALWLRDTLPIYARDVHPHLAGESEYVNYVDMFAGLSYDLLDYFSPYIFVEAYYDRPDPENQWGTFSAIGFSGTLYNEGKHKLSYYTEWYFTLNTYDLDAWRFWSTESAVKYKYKIYDKTSLYLQAVWNTDTDAEGYGVPGYSEGIYSTRLGIQVYF